jgi:SM-20-related protein
MRTEHGMMARIVADLGAAGWAVVPGFLAPVETAAMATECIAAWEGGEFRRAGIGTGAALKIDDHVRRDHVLWLDEVALSDMQHLYWNRLEQLRLEINRALILGLFSFEGHFAVYAPGAFYRKHLDQFAATRHRVVSCILYLNDDWMPADGGQLRLYLDGSGAGEYLDIAPQGGTLVVFLSGRFYHEVLPARRERMSLTGWFRTRS